MALIDYGLSLDPQLLPPEAKAVTERCRQIASRLLTGAPRLDSLKEHAKLLDRLSPVLSVDELRLFKPHPGVYALAEERLGLARDRILFVSSNAWDVAGALSFGFHVAWVNRAGLPAERLGPAPDLVVSDLGELAGHLGGAGRA